MKRTSALVLSLLVWSMGSAAGRIDAQGTSPSRVSLRGALSRQAAAFAVSRAVRSLPPEASVPDSGQVRGGTVRVIRNPRVRGDKPIGQGDEWVDLAVQSTMPTLSMPAVMGSFEGLSSNDNVPVYGGRVLPPDTTGDIGPNHYVEQTNLLVRIFNRTGTPLTAPFKLSSLFASGGICQSTDEGDPIVLYDPLADRWLLSQFAFTTVSANVYHECIAISTSPDPAGTYFLYDFTTPNNEFPDYPKFGVWPDGYYMTVNQFVGGGPFDGTGVYAFDRARMLAGDPGASLLYFNLNLASHPEGIGGMLPSDLDGLRPPPAGTPNVFAYFVATEFGDALDGLRLFNFHADFATPFNSTFLERAGSPLPVAAFDPTGSGIQQPGTGARLDRMSDRLMHRLQYRNTGSAETLVVTHTVDADPAVAFKAGVRYYELRRSGGAYAVNEQATFSPDSTHRWMGSAAEDHDGNLAVGYSVSSSSVFPGIRYAGRLATDPVGGLFQGEATLIAGSGSQTHNSGRWGDYSALTVDPVDDCTFYFATEYYTAAGQATSSAAWQTRVGTFKFPSCSPLARGGITVNVTDCATSGDIPAASVRINGVLYGATNATGDLTANVVPGSYTVTATKSSASVSQPVTVGDGGTATANLCLGSATLTPDLVVTALSALNKAGAGQTVKVKDTTANSGAGAAAASTTRLWLSADQTLGGSDTVLGERSVPALAPGVSSVGPTNVVIPAATTPGTYYLIAKSDGPDAIAESDETNNIRTRKIVIGPDLQVTAVSVTGAASPGTTVSVSDTTKNTGGGSTVVGSVTRFYLSINTSVDAGDVLLGSRPIPVLAAGASSAASTPLTIPPSTPPGTYHIIALSDATGVVTETNETNNKRAFAITINP